MVVKKVKSTSSSDEMSLDVVDDNKFVLVVNKLNYFFGVMVRTGVNSAKQPVLKHCVLYPGVNEVRYGIWKIAQENPLVQTKLDEGDLLYRGEKSFMDLDQKKQAQFAKNIFDKRLIQHLKNSTVDQEVLRALNEQIEAINNGSRIV